MWGRSPKVPNVSNKHDVPFSRRLQIQFSFHNMPSLHSPYCKFFPSIVRRSHPLICFVRRRGDRPHGYVHRIRLERCAVYCSTPRKRLALVLRVERVHSFIVLVRLTFRARECWPPHFIQVQLLSPPSLLGRWWLFSRMHTSISRVSKAAKEHFPVGCVASLDLQLAGPCHWVWQASQSVRSSPQWPHSQLSYIWGKYLLFHFN